MGTWEGSELGTRLSVAITGHRVRMGQTVGEGSPTPGWEGSVDFPVRPSVQ